jgi:hypothetical protein
MDPELRFLYVWMLGHNFAIAKTKPIFKGIEIMMGYPVKYTLANHRVIKRYQDVVKLTLRAK